MANILTKMRESFATGLRRTNINTCSKWAENYIYMAEPFPGPMSFKYHPWTREMHDSEASKNVGQKAAQVGYTVTMMNRAFYVIDHLRSSVLYLLPSKNPDATDFSSTKFDPALEMSPHLADMFSDVKNVGTKRAGSAILYVRGANSRKGLKSISVTDVFCDEYDEMPDHTIPLAGERMSGQKRKRLWLISTPRFPGKGINAEYLDSTQEHFFFYCPSCNKVIELLHENLVVTADDIHDDSINQCHVKCVECTQIIVPPDFNGADQDLKLATEYAEFKADLLKGSFWEPMGHKDFENRGFYVNQLYSPTITPKTLGIAWLKSLTNKAAEQEYHNSKMGDAHEVEGARVTADAIDSCIIGRDKLTVAPRNPGLITMGVDVGGWLHYEINLWRITKMGNDINVASRPEVIDEGKRLHFQELDELMYHFQIMMCVIDWQPETRKAVEFAKRFFGHVRLCRYTEGNENSINLEDKDRFIITAAKTFWLDMALGRFFKKGIDLPRNLSLEYRSQVQNTGKIYEEDRDGNIKSRYIKNGNDHFAHARNYSEIALPLAASVATNSDIGAFL